MTAPSVLEVSGEHCSIRFALTWINAAKGWLRRIGDGTLIRLGNIARRMFAQDFYGCRSCVKPGSWGGLQSTGTIEHDGPKPAQRRP